MGTFINVNMVVLFILFVQSKYSFPDDFIYLYTP